MDKLILKPINDLLNENFFIPSYQRGYRWKKEQVKNLLDDIWNFRLNSEDESREVFYCLQPVVVSKIDNEWELIDGQQRLTTISIIMQYLKKQMDALDKNKYSIRYETRTESKTFIESLSADSLTNRNDNVDYYHICEAYDAVADWFSTKDGNTKIHFLTTLLNDNQSGKNVKVIWYDVSEENKNKKYAIDIFTRLNIGKIPLTNSELVKALFLMKSNFEEQATLKQIQIATEWDAIEKKLQDDSFWYFIYSPKNSIQYENRIEYIFDLMQQKTKDDEEHYTFNKFLEKFEENTTSKGKLEVDTIWLDIKHYFLRLEEWYQNRDLYHLIGFLIEYEADINKLIEASKSRTKTEFITYLTGKIKKQLTHINLVNLDFYNGKDKKDIRKVLLLFNIQTILSSTKADMRFPFNKFKKDKWDIEHVNSQTEKHIDSKNRKSWALDVLEFFTGTKGFSDKVIIEKDNKTEAEIQKENIELLSEKDNAICKKLIQILESEKVEDDFFDEVFTEMRKEFKEDDVKDNNGISNLALLDESTNRSYGNAMFPIKRNRIIDNDSNGIFVPIGTKNLFLKYYSKKMGDAMYWQQKDANDYLMAIQEVLKQYLPTKKTNL
ncbi:DUF262 domain-containing protein [Flavobacterium psychrophilum]